MSALLNTIKTAITGTRFGMPIYTVVVKTEIYEERRYPETKWVSTKVEGMFHKESRSTGFRRLFNYLQGDNKPSRKVDMTAPVATKIFPGPGPNCESMFTVSFFILPENADNSPVPTNPDVYLETWPPLTIYAKQFDGSPSDDNFVSNAQELGQALSGKNINPNVWFTASYDSPFKMFNKRNEVWYLKLDEENKTKSEN
ncbi:hypothetical protein SNE40_006096 [Patella caerulea]|uniref:SOUL heme-binding protein n=1 Tax=Patella caerulea TaxID=87958 RepID=A0AAN8JZP0_PATCE